MIPYEDLYLSNQQFHKQYAEVFEKVLKEGWFILGKKTGEFENEFSRWNQSKYCVGVGNGLDALIMILRSLNLPPSAEVIVPSNTYIATILAVIHNNLKPVLAEPDRGTYNLTAKTISEKITVNTKAVLVVHLYGKCSPMEEIMELGKQNNLTVIEDCAQSHGAKYKDQLCGNFGIAAGFSFYPTKNLGALGDGGAVVTNTPVVAEQIKKLRNYGSEKKYFNSEVGFNSRLDELQAAFLLIKLSHLHEIIAHKRKLASIYHQNLKDDFIKPVIHPDYFDVYHIFTVRHAKRDQLKEYLFKKGIQTEIHYPVPPHRQKALEKFFQGEVFPVADEIHNTILSLPCSLCHTEDDILSIVEVMNKF